MRSARLFSGLLAATAIAVLVSGCASPAAPSSAMLTYETTPEGAKLFEGSQALGQAPVTRTYKAEAGARTITTPDVTAVWPSGARTSYFTVLEVGADRVARIERPAGAPGLEADLAHAKLVAADRKLTEEREKEDALRDEARLSGRCQAQMAGGGSRAIDDCR
jgi:hypothetical protein